MVGELRMKITYTRMLEASKKYKLTNEEFLSMCRSNEFNPFEDELIRKIIITVIATSVITNLINSLLDNKQIRKRKRGKLK